VAIDGSGLLVCHDAVNGDQNSTVLKGLTPYGVDPDDGLTCSSKRLQRTVTQNRHFNEQAEFVTRQGAHPDSCPRWRRSLSGPSCCPRRGEYAGATGWVAMDGTTVSRGSDRLARSAAPARLQVSAWAQSRGVPCWDSESSPDVLPMWMRQQSLTEYNSELTSALRQSRVALVAQYHWAKLYDSPYILNWQ
jgi:hypothetical protein